MSAAAALQNPASNGRLWSLSVALAVLLHVIGAVTALMTLRGEIDDDMGGAPAIELSLEPAAPRDADAPDLPPGPQTDESAAAAPSAASEAKEAKDENIARAEAEDAELTRNERPDKPVEEQKSQQSQQVISNESAASEATAPPKSEVARVSDKPVAPTQGNDAAARAAVVSWQKQLMSHLNRAKRYPAGGARRSAQVTLAFTLDRRGHVTAASVKKSSGQPNFDEAALAMMKRADPVPPPPPVIADQSLSFEVPVVYRADRR